MRRAWALAACCWLIAGGAWGAEPDWKLLAERWLAAAYPDPGARWEAAVLQAPANARAGEPARVLGVRGAGKKPKRILALSVLLGPAGDDRTGTLMVQADRFWTVAAATRTLPRGAKLAPADWQWIERNAAGMQADAVRAAGALENKRTRKTVAAGEALTEHALESVPEVAAGQELTLQVRGDGVVISTTAQALESGSRGESIRLQPERGRPVRARILGPETAEIVITRRP